MARALRDLPRPLIALLVGGPTKPYRFDQAVAGQLMKSARHAGRGWLTLHHHQPPHAGRGGWRPRGRAPGQRAFTMARRRRQPLPRAARARRPVHRHRRQHLDDGRGGQAGQTARHLRAARGAARAALARHARPAPGGARGQRGGLVLGPLSDALHRLRIAKYARDLSEIHRRLYARGLAVPLGQPFLAPQTRPSDDLARAVERVRALMARPPA